LSGLVTVRITRGVRDGSAAKAGRTWIELKEEVEEGSMTPRLKERYRQEIVAALREQLGYGNDLQAPRLEKIVVNMGVGEGAHDPKAIDGAMKDMSIITGQKPRLNRARRSVAGFKLRTGMSVGCKVTLRGDRMYEFLDRLTSLAIPRVRDFRGLNPKSFDGKGNFNMGLDEQLVFPEIDYDNIDKVRGMDITIVTTAMTDEEGLALLEAFGMPFRGK
jgi:large subunit ribosomal protein L5